MIPISKLSKKIDKYLMLINKFYLWLFWDFSGLRFIWFKIRPELEGQLGKRKPATFFLWTIGIYVALFGVASQRYESRIDIIENRANAVFAQLAASESRSSALSKIAIVQNMKSHLRPDILKPQTVIQSFYSQTYYAEMVELLKGTVEDWKKHLSGVDLTNVDLKRANLREANLKGAVLRNANLKEAWLDMANLQESDLLKANLQKAVIDGTNFQNATLTGANLKEVNLQEVYTQKPLSFKVKLPQSSAKNTILSSTYYYPDRSVTIGVKTNFRGAFLMGANLQKAKVPNGNFQKAYMKIANLQGANLRGANLQEANLGGANLEEADLIGADFQEADLYGTNLKEAKLDGANFIKVKNISVEQLCEVNSLKGIKLDQEVYDEVMERCPELLT